MDGVKLVLALVVAILLQWTLRGVFEPLSFIDLPLIVIVYAAMQRNSIRALLFAAVSGLAVDALSGGLLGAGGFSKVVVAYLVSELARRVYLDNVLLRIPVLAGATLLSGLLYYGAQRFFGQTPYVEPLTTISYMLIGTTIAGTFIYMAFDGMFSGRLRPRRRDGFGSRRQTRRRNPIRLRK